jgi:GntR family transcriptional regulator
MVNNWRQDQPIYRQLRDRIVALILEHAIPEGDPLPSARTIAAEYRINPLTVLKAFQGLAEEGLVENRRGVGMFVNPGARERLLRAERKRFLDDEWPRVAGTIHRLGIKTEDLLRGIRAPTPRPKSGKR